MVQIEPGGGGLNIFHIIHLFNPRLKLIYVL